MTEGHMLWGLFSHRAYLWLTILGSIIVIAYFYYQAKKGVGFYDRQPYDDDREK